MRGIDPSALIPLAETSSFFEKVELDFESTDLLIQVVVSPSEARREAGAAKIAGS